MVLAIAGTTLPSTLAHADQLDKSRAALAVLESRGPAPAEGASDPQHVDGDRDCARDTTGDTTDRRADIASWCVYYGDDALTVGMGLVEATHPATHPSWIDGLTAAVWSFDTTGDEEGDYTAFLLNADGEVGAVMLDDDGDLVCGATTVQADTRAYVAGFSPSCLGGAERATAVAVMVFDAAPGSGNSDDLHFDIAPDGSRKTVIRHTHAAPSPAPKPAPAPAPAPAPRGGLRETGRIAGPDRLSTAVAISQRAFPDGAPVVYLARQDLNPDALVAGALSDGPVLLVPACGPLPQVVADEIRRLGALQVFALGGAGSVCQQLLDAAAAA